MDIYNLVWTFTIASTTKTDKTKIKQQNKTKIKQKQNKTKIKQQNYGKRPTSPQSLVDGTVPNTAAEFPR